MSTTTTTAGEDPILEILELSEDRLTFQLRRCRPAVANALRRTVLSDVPTLAIDLVELTPADNTGMLHDDMLAHRLGLIPLQLLGPLSGMRRRPECDCTDAEGCPRCTVQLELHAFNPPDAPGPHTVMSEELRTPAGRPQLCQPAISGIALTVLAPGQQVQLRCWAHLGSGREHAKWCPVSECSYRNPATVELALEPERQDSVLQTLSAEERREWVDSCPTGVFEVSSATGEVEVRRPELCTLCDECQWAGEELGRRRGLLSAEALQPFREMVRIRPQDDCFLFTLESTGSLRPGEILLSALEVLQRRLRELQAEIPED